MIASGKAAAAQKLFLLILSYEKKKVLNIVFETLTFNNDN